MSDRFEERHKRRVNRRAERADAWYERQNRRYHQHQNNFHRSTPWGGVVLILIGIGLIINRIPGIFDFMPEWLFTWPMILILIGIFISLKRRSPFAGVVPFLIGLFFLFKIEGMIDTTYQPYLVPVFLILLGLYVLWRRHYWVAHRDRCSRHRPDFHNPHWPPPPPHGATAAGATGFQEQAEKKQDDNARQQGTTEEAYDDTAEFVDINSVFGAIEKSCFSKNFRGGRMNCVFGGGKLNLTQADIQGTAILNVSINFGGGEIIVPANWNIKNELDALFGGVEDKRHHFVNEEMQSKTLILKGNVFCGGIELKS